jgi:hypothetical protein
VEVGEFVATLLRLYLSIESPDTRFPISPDLCIAYDVHQGQRVSAPKAFKRRLDQIESGCKEIVTLWPSI